MVKAKIGAMCVANGMGEKYEDGPYIKVALTIGKETHFDLPLQHVLISKGEAENLCAELTALVAKMK